jgi:GDP-4-dehydro-6-deoxy-D-mannose reductase
MPWGSLDRVRIWMSGAKGFVGSRLGVRLGASGHVLVGVDREVEITDAARVATSIRDAAPDAIVHLAAVSSSVAAREAPETAARVNFLGTRAVLEAARCIAPSARVLLVTSGEIYGSSVEDTRPIREDHPLAPRTAYARTKACADLLGARYARDGLDVLRVRPFNHTGPGQPPDFVAPSFAQQIARIARGEREPLMRVGNLESVRDFLDLEDVLDAYERLLDPGVAPGAYNVASGEGRRIGDLLDILLAESGVTCRVESDPARMRPTDHAVGDAGRLRAATGWAPRIPFRDTLKQLLAAA